METGHRLNWQSESFSSSFITIIFFFVLAVVVFVFFVVLCDDIVKTEFSSLQEAKFVDNRTSPKKR